LGIVNVRLKVLPIDTPAPPKIKAKFLKEIPQLLGDFSKELTNS
jgi:hypothetical protein